MSISDYSVTIGDSNCPVTALEDKLMYCTINKHIVYENNMYVVVRAGSREWMLGYIVWESEWSSWLIIITIAILILIAIATSLIVWKLLKKSDSKLRSCTSGDRYEHLQLQDVNVL